MSRSCRGERQGDGSRRHRSGDIDGTIQLLDHLTLDGVMQGPAGPEEDTRNGFDRGGWAMARNDQVMGEFLGKGMSSEGGLLLGRRTFEAFAAYWARRTAEATGLPVEVRPFQGEP